MTAPAVLVESPEVESWSELLERQRKLEDTGMADGADRFRKKLAQAEAAGASSTTGAARLLIQGAIDNLENAIRSTIENWPAGKGRQPLVVTWSKRVGPDVAAYMTMKVVVDSTVAGTPRSLHRVADSISTLILDELRYRRFKEQAPALYQYKIESFDTTHSGHRARSLDASMRFAKIDTRDLDIPNHTRLRLGIQLIDLLCESTDWFQCGHLADPSKKYSKKTVLVMSPETQQRISARNDVLSLLSPLVPPMVVPPLPWSPGQRGGYRFALRNKFSLVRRVSKSSERRLKDADMPLVYEAVNAIQGTAWQINAPVLALVGELVDLGGGFAGIPRSTDDALPQQPEDIETNEDARKAWRSAAHAVRNRNYDRRIQAAEVDRVVSVARSFAAERALYFPHSLDFRGRVYPLASYLTPQGDDLSRSLLRFAEGKPVDEAGGRWLAIHGANMMGVTPEGEKVSRMTLDQRVAWVIANRERIFEVADSPFDTAWWVRADNPLQFFAFAVEWAAYLRATEQGEDYASSLPVYMDGTANGLQHFAALLRDPTSASAVNLVPNGCPQDIYQQVADAILKRLTTDATTDPLADLWLSLHRKVGLVDRKLAKRPTMTFGYGSRKFGFSRQIEHFLMDRTDFREIKDHFTHDQSPVFRPACTYLASVTWEALKSTAVAAHDTMAWLNKVAWGITAENRSIAWTVPATGFPVYQGYFELRKKPIQTALAGRMVSVKAAEPTAKVHRQKEANSISANAIHSLDAAALMLSVVRATEEGINSFGMIHDSYGAIPADCQMLSEILRDSFIRLYTDHDVLGSLNDQFRGQWADPSECPLPPAQGSLDLEGIRRSDYFFC